jgi:HEAT repeat protein
MKPIVTILSLVFGLAFATAPGPDPVQTAFDKLVDAATKTDWPAESAARKELTTLGPKALPKLTDAAQSHAEVRVRRACYELLTGPFANDPTAIDTAIQFGLHDQDAKIRYECAFLLGDLKVHRAAGPLRAALDAATGNDAEFLRFTLSKSLAQLGEGDVLPTLFAAVSDDSYMARYVGNIGLKALSGKNLEDFEGYHYPEGAYVIGGQELATGFDAIAAAEKKVERFRAATAYFKWLKSERPELYKYATYRTRR